MLAIPEGLVWLEDSPKGREWLSRLPGIVGTCIREWSLTRVGEPFPYAFASIAMPVRFGDADAVLKVQFPDRESRHEAAALDLWDGDGAVRLLAHDARRSALVIERCRPGSPLSELELDAALDVACDLFPRLWKPAGAPFTALADEAAWWAESLEADWSLLGQPFSRSLLDAALDAIRTLSASQPEAVLVHQDMHALNILRSQREPWLVIDPKPLVGERAFGIAALVRGDELGRGRKNLLRRFDRLTADLSIDRGRARGWCLAQTLAWGLDATGVDRRMVQTARWLRDLDLGDT